jgi:hypothetical protein
MGVLAATVMANLREEPATRLRAWTERLGDV